jgi:P27 family predicted phage terminase small subunit
MSAGQYPGPKPIPRGPAMQPSDRRHLHAVRVSHRAVEPPISVGDHEGLPTEPDWEQTFPRPARRRELAQAGRRQPVESEEQLDSSNRRCRHVAHATWSLVVPELHAKKLLAKVDVLALHMLCVTVARLDQAERDLSINGAMSRGREGTVVKNPALTAARQYRDQFNRLIPEFGLSPSARMRLRVGDFGTEEGDGLFD